MTAQSVCGSEALVVGELEVTWAAKYCQRWVEAAWSAGVPDTSLFSRMVPSGSSILAPSLATMMTVPLNVTPRPNETSPATVKWSLRPSRQPPRLKVGGRGDAQLEHLGDGPEALLERGDLLEVVAELDDRRREEHARGVHDEPAVLEEVQVRRDEEQVRARLDGEETATGNVDAVRVAGETGSSAIAFMKGRDEHAPEVLDRGADGSLELDDGLAGVRDLVVDDDLEVHAIVVHDALDGAEVDPEAVDSRMVSFALALPSAQARITHLLVLKIWSGDRGVSSRNTRSAKDGNAP